jgi:FtsZ-binding cell division protein ZapB
MSYEKEMFELAAIIETQKEALLASTENPDAKVGQSVYNLTISAMRVNDLLRGKVEHLQATFDSVQSQFEALKVLSQQLLDENRKLRGQPQTSRP